MPPMRWPYYEGVLLGEPLLRLYGARITSQNK